MNLQELELISRRSGRFRRTGQSGPTRAQSSRGWFVATWVLLGVVSFVLSLYGSAMIVSSFDEPTHCHMESPCSLGTMLAESVYSLCCLWCSFLGSGAVSMMVGQSAAHRTIRAVANRCHPPIVVAPARLFAGMKSVARTPN